MTYIIIKRAGMVRELIQFIHVYTVGLIIPKVIPLKLFFKTWYPVLPQIMLPHALRGCFRGGVVVFSKDENAGNAAWAVHVGRIFVT